MGLILIVKAHPIPQIPLAGRGAFASIKQEIAAALACALRRIRGTVAREGCHADEESAPGVL